MLHVFNSLYQGWMSTTEEAVVTGASTRRSSNVAPRKGLLLTAYTVLVTVCVTDGVSSTCVTLQSLSPLSPNNTLSSTPHARLSEDAPQAASQRSLRYPITQPSSPPQRRTMVSQTSSSWTNLRTNSNRGTVSACWGVRRRTCRRCITTGRQCTKQTRSRHPY